ncbi:MAG: Ig-like domain-containing protein, partial [Thermodesulfobacteriota bacterium]|nr:Ig-like domain-containing protein [Thermodesulfobacteriota bacterium]
MCKKILSLLVILFVISTVAVPVYADQTVFGPKDLKIGRWHFHFSSHRFKVDDPAPGVLSIIKNTPDKKIRGGFCFVNGKYIGLRSFLRGTASVLEKDVQLRSKNRVFVFLRGDRRASIKIQIKKKGTTPPPEVTLSTNPTTIHEGQSSTLSWTSTYADTCTIDPDVGSVDLNGSATVSPPQTTTYTITATGSGGTATANATVTVANSAPVANNQTVTLNEDETASVTLTASDINGDSLTYQIVTGPSHGSLTGQAPNLSYTPSLNYNGSDTFTFKANDGSLDSNTATVTLSIQPVNDSPTAAGDVATTNEDTPITAITVLANDTDPDGDALAVDDFTQPAHGTAGSNGDGTLTYTPDEDFNGMDSFNYTVSDGNGGTDTATVSITIHPVNDAPMANHQTVTLNEDETASTTLTASDADGDTLTYQVVSSPSQGTLTGTAPDLSYTPAANYNGIDSFTFKANDGTIDSNEATVNLTVNAINDPPVANAGPDQTALQNSVVTLDGSGSGDIDQDPLTYNWSFVTAPAGSTATLSDSSVVNPTFTADLTGIYEIQLMVNDGTVNSAPDTIMVNVFTLPTIEISANPVAILTDESSTLTWKSTHADTCVIEPGVGSVVLNGSTSVSPTQTTTYTITATNPGGTATASVTVTVNVPPAVSFSASPATIAQGGSATLSWSSENAQSAHIDNGIGVVSTDGTISVSPEHTTTYTLSVTGPAGNASAKATVKVTGNPLPQPDGSFGQQYEDLIPPDSTVDEYDAYRFSLITGIVHSIDDAPIPDVSITIHNHPEYGTVSTDTSGRFSIPVEGGGTMTVVYQKNGLITSHRKVYAPWNDIAITETIQMIEQDPVSTNFTFDGNANTIVTHQSTEVTDEFGSRSCSIVFTGDNHAWLVDENGNDVQQLETISVRASEFTTPDSMPAILPPNSAYTYCAELSVDGAQRVRFDKPVITWVDNFLGFDVGMIVPVGYYDHDRGVWVSSENGVVVKLLDIDLDGIVDSLDADGDGQPNDLNEDGSYSDEVTGLEDAGKYVPDAEFWRVEMDHFSEFDWNWPFHLPEDAEAPNPDAVALADQKIREEKDCKGYNSSFVEERSRIFHEDILIPGIDMSLHYASNRVQGYEINVNVPVSGETVPASLKYIIVKMKVAGRRFKTTLDPQPNQIAKFGWDGQDYLGGKVKFSAPAQIEIGFAYDALYGKPSDYHNAWAQAGGDLTQVKTRQEIISWKRSNIILQRGLRSVGYVIADGWTISSHHSLSLRDLSKLHKGDGTMVENNVSIIDTVAGNGVSGYSGDGGPSTDAQLYFPDGVTIDAAGNQYIADTYNHRIRKIDTDGIITTIAGNGIMGYNGDGMPATEATLNYPKGVAIDSSGNLYIADSGSYRIRKVDTIGIITTVAGGGSTIGDGLATQRTLYWPGGVTLDTWGNLYIADTFNHRIRKVDPAGLMTTVAGTGGGYWMGYAQGGFSGDGGPGIEAELDNPTDVAIDSSGNLYIADQRNNRIRKVDTSGIITTVAGSGDVGGGNGGFDGDGGLATEALLNYPHGLAVDTTGNIFIADQGNNRIRKVNTSGIIATIAGNGIWGYSGDGGSAIKAQLQCFSVAADSTGNIFITGVSNTIRKVGSYGVFINLLAEGDIPFAEKDGMGHIMSSSGRHKTTFDLDIGITIREFEYDSDNNLIAIIDQFGNQTIINRDGNGVPTSIVSPDGITTLLTIDGNNHLTDITYPDNNNYSFEYTSDGLMTAKIEPEGNRFEHQFNSQGRLTDATDEEGGHWNYQRIGNANGDVLTEVTTGEGNQTTYLDHTESTGSYTSTITGPTGAETQYSQSPDGLTVNKSLPCGMDLVFKYDVDSEYKFKYVKDMHETSPSGLEKIVLREKTYEDTNSDEIKDLITQTVTVNGKVTSLVNNVLQSKKTVTAPEGRTVTTQYNPATLLTESVSIRGLNTTNYGYNPQGRLTSIITGTREATLSYNAQGFMDSYTDPEGYTTTYTHDTVGRVTGIGRPDGSSLGFTYDGNGNMTVLTNPSSIQHGFGFNAVNLNSSYQTPISGTYSYVYDRDRRLTEINFPSGQQIRNIYDTTRLSQVQTPEGNIDYTYLCGTNVESITKGTESITYGYDGKLVTSESLTGTLNQALAYTYNNDFDVTGFSYAGGTENYTYDNDGLLTGAGSFTIIRNVQNGLPESLSGSTLSQNRTFNGYGEQDGQVSTISGQSISSWSLAQDDNGQIVQKIETVDGITSTYDYTYDPMGRLITVTKDGSMVEEYDYDINGTRIYEMNTLRGITGKSFTYSDEDHLLTAGTASYQYDIDGFLATKTDGSDVTTYNYSSRGELLSVNLPNGNVIGYTHDPLGRRIVKMVNGITVEKYLWQGLTRLLAVYDGSDNLIMRFEYADDRMPVAMTRGGATYYLTYDQVGSLRAVADSAGNVVKRTDYDSFGNIIVDSNPSFDMPFGFAGGLRDWNTGLLRFGYRDYDPDIGRWTAKDPILFAGGDTDLYGYVLNDPVN